MSFHFVFAFLSTEIACKGGIFSKMYLFFWVTWIVKILIIYFLILSKIIYYFAIINEVNELNEMLNISQKILIKNFRIKIKCWLTNAFS